MKILVAGASGYIGLQLLQVLLEGKHEVVALMRHPEELFPPVKNKLLTIIKSDLLLIETLKDVPKDIDIAYYLVHSMRGGKDFPAKEEQAILNFLQVLKKTSVKQLIYLSGLTGDQKLSKHLASRLKTECLIQESGIPYTVLRAGIIVGAGSASFEIVRDLVEKLPFMVAPKWVNNLCQPIAVQDVLTYLQLVMLHPSCLNQTFDIGGPEQLTYREILLGYAEVRGLKRYILVVPVLTPRLSSYWLYGVTSVNFQLASALVDSLKNRAVCRDFRIHDIFPHRCLTYRESLQRALDVIEQNPLLPSLQEENIPPEIEARLGELASIPLKGCFFDRKKVLSAKSSEELIKKVWAIGGKTGWYYMDWAWKFRGFIDKLAGGIGLRDVSPEQRSLTRGAPLDFWRVIVADRKRGVLLLHAEMKLPGDAWLEFRVEPASSGCQLIQTASFRPKGLLGYIYWYLLLPIHHLIFNGMAKAIAG